jgi:hypothetical protein
MRLASLSIALLSLATIAFAADAPSTAPESKPADKAAKKDPTYIAGTGKFGGGPVTWSAQLTPTKTPGVYKADYKAAWGGNKNMTYVGEITSDFKTEIKCFGKATGGGGNGTFEFSAKFDDKGIAASTYKEIGGNRNRSGPINADLNTLK